MQGSSGTDLKTYKFNHTMIRIKDPKASLQFYTEVLGMTQLHKHDSEGGKFTLYFLAYNSEKAANHGRSRLDREGILELTHNWGTENDPNFKYHTGNSEPRGFGHIAISVDNIEAACARFEEKGAKFKKKLTDGRQRDIAFVLDPDEYWVEIVSLPKQQGQETSNTTDLSTYRFNHSMIRVKDPVASLKFYQEILGLSLLKKVEFAEAKFDLYFLAYTQGKDLATSGVNPGANIEGVLELTHNYGTENDSSFKGYASGNEEPRGFGHICVIVDDIEAACQRFEQLNVTFQKRLKDGKMHHIAFIKDVDGYWVEIIENDSLKK